LLQPAGKPQLNASSSDLLAEVFEKAIRRKRIVVDRRPPGASRRRPQACGLNVGNQGAHHSGDIFTIDPQSFPVPLPRGRDAGDARGGQDGNGLRARRRRNQKGRPRFGDLREGIRKICGQSPFSGPAQLNTSLRDALMYCGRREDVAILFVYRSGSIRGNAST